jgi:hypothetical protein
MSRFTGRVEMTGNGDEEAGDAVLRDELAEMFIDRFNRDHGVVSRDCLFVQKLRESGLSRGQIAAVIVCMGDTCRHCRDADTDCMCWNDE